MISKCEWHDYAGYLHHTNRKTKVPTHYSHSPGIHLKGNWLAEAGFDTGRGVTVRISQGCIVLIADCDEVQELGEQLYQMRQVVKGIKDVVV
ncbi:SymE family type I addiction module toxin [Citrobacter freundii]|uniref:SymE family type I addiction module toxin n=1 Tax=Citrobacter freundii TaxID=546 RepID=UPI001A219D8B|nr:SymE family type I addiction module toxin [Citrobacter freundii]WQC31410.1 SymE family type I addiction module toxin [Citrobacter freundii]HAT4042329.1 type I addiction module toxin, SymE family [Citrobacter freundii]